MSFSFQQTYIATFKVIPADSIAKLTYLSILGPDLTILGLARMKQEVQHYDPSFILNQIYAFNAF